MPSAKPRSLQRLEWERAAVEYSGTLPLEHFMESTSQATQRAITLASLELVHAQRPDIQAFNELLVQYEHGKPPERRRVVPDNMIVVWHEPIRATGSYNVPFQPVGPFCVLEYVSQENKRKDYDDNFIRYEQELKVPYSLLFAPDIQELTLFRRGRRKYVAVRPNKEGRLAIPQLELEVALLEGWVRFWFRGELLPLPAEMQRGLREARRELVQVNTQLVQVNTQLVQANTQLVQVNTQLEEERRARLAAEEELARLRAQQAPKQQNRGGKE
jgi:Uma2 family endonuclease